MFIASLQVSFKKKFKLNALLWELVVLWLLLWVPFSTTFINISCCPLINSAFCLRSIIINWSLSSDSASGTMLHFFLWFHKLEWCLYSFPHSQIKFSELFGTKIVVFIVVFVVFLCLGVDKCRSYWDFLLVT